VAELQHGLFTAEQAKAARYSVQAEHHNAKIDNWIREYRGIYRLTAGRRVRNDGRHSWRVLRPIVDVISEETLSPDLIELAINQAEQRGLFTAKQLRSTKRRGESRGFHANSCRQVIRVKYFSIRIDSPLLPVSWSLPHENVTRLDSI
jgi:hypothetical protein